MVYYYYVMGKVDCRRSQDVTQSRFLAIVNIYAGELLIRNTCNFNKPLNNILKVMHGSVPIFCLLNINTHTIGIATESVFYRFAARSIKQSGLALISCI